MRLRLDSRGRGSIYAALWVAIFLFCSRTIATESTFLSPSATTSAFLDSIGINVHLSFLDSPYGNLPLVLHELDSLGVHHVRDGANPADFIARQTTAWLQLRSHGIRVNSVLDPRYAVRTVSPKSLLALLSVANGVVESIEGPNELDVSELPDWPAVDREYQRSIWESRRSLGIDRANVPLIGPSMAFALQGKKLGDISAYVDYGNLHPYPGGHQPSVIFPDPDSLQAFFDDRLAQAAVMYGGLPIYVTETGWHNCFGEQKGTPATSLEATARYVPRLFLENFNHGIHRTYLYELIDWHADPHQANHEYHWGLLQNDGTEKPAFRTLQTLIALVDDATRMPVDTPAQAAAIPVSFRYQIESTTWVAPHSTALRARDGSLLLLLWQEVPSYSIVEQRDIDVPTLPVRVRLDRAAPSARLFDVSRGTQPLQQWTAGATFELQVPDHVLILRIGSH
jgi:hypothetical protein